MPVPTDIAPDLPGSGCGTGDAAETPDALRPTPRDERLLRSQRLLRRAEFVRVQQQGRRVHTDHFILLMLRANPAAARPPASGSCPVRLGVTVGRRVGCAVKRNRIKRVVREVFRKNRELFPRDCDVVLVARPGADRLDYSSVLGELVRAQAAIERVRRQWSAESKSASEP